MGDKHPNDTDQRPDEKQQKGPKGEQKDDDLLGEEQSGDARPQDDGIGQYQGGGIDDAIGGGTSGQGGG